MTIHWLDLLTKRNISFGFHATMTAMSSSTTFFQKVCQLVSTMASPKHPQSLMGLAMASHSVSRVMTTMMPTSSLETSRLWMAKSRQIPMRNSTIERMTAAHNIRLSDTNVPRCIA